MSLLVYVVYHVKFNFFLFCTNSFIFQSQSLWLGLIGWLGLHGFLGLLGLTVFFISSFNENITCWNFGLLVY